MEIVMLGICAVVSLSCLSANLLVAYMLWQHWHDKKSAAQPVAPEETPEEIEARKAAARAQALYEQGFVNLMGFDGRPPKKERDVF